MRIFLLTISTLLFLSATAAEIYLTIPPSTATRERLMQSARPSAGNTNRQRRNAAAGRSSTRNADTTPLPGVKYEDELPGTVFCTFCKAYTLPTDNNKCSLCGSNLALYGVGENTPVNDGTWLMVALSICYIAMSVLIIHRRSRRTSDIVI